MSQPKRQGLQFGLPDKTIFVENNEFSFDILSQRLREHPF